MPRYRAPLIFRRTRSFDEFQNRFHSALEEARGHSIAILKRAEGKYSLFDPNLGVYSVEGRHKLIGATILLLIDGYGRGTLDMQDNWSLFCKTDDLVPSLQPEQSGAPRDAYIVRDHALAQMQGFIQKGAKEAFEQIDAYKKAVDKRKKLLLAETTSKRCSHPTLNGSFSSAGPLVR